LKTNKTYPETGVFSVKFCKYTQSTRFLQLIKSSFKRDIFFVNSKTNAYLCALNNLLTTKLKEMYLDSEKKKEIFEKYGKSNTDTGSPEAQIALFSYRIAHLTEHLKSNHKDHSTERALKMLVGKRRRLLDYLIKVDINRYRAIIAQKELGIRK
jgi:ribosomal protein S15